MTTTTRILCPSATHAAVLATYLTCEDHVAVWLLSLLDGDRPVVVTTAPADAVAAAIDYTGVVVL